MRPRSTSLALLAGILAVPAAARAQGSLGAQGFGYPTGQLSTRALGTGGALGELDPASPLNPAEIAYYRRPTIGVQFDPEFRRVTTGGATQKGSIMRFPLIAFGLPIRDRLAIGVSASTLLDRSFSTSYQATSNIGGRTVTSTETVEARGSIADLRFGLGGVVTRWLRVGAAVHALTGENRVVSGRQFADTTQFGSVADSTTLDYRGWAASGGIELTPVRGLALAASYRRGGSLDVQRNDTTLRSADAPDRYGVALRFDRITGASFAATYARTSWTRMRGLGSSALDVRDTPELGLGVEALGPRLGETATLLRLGGRQRTLPFGLNGSEIRETSIAGGLGIPLGQGRAMADLALQHAARSPRNAAGALAGVRERAWTFSLGLSVRP